MVTRGALGFSHSSKWNFSISSSSDRRDEAISSSGIATTSERICGSGSATSGRSSRAKKFGCEMSIRANLGSPALIALFFVLIYLRDQLEVQN